MIGGRVSRPLGERRPRRSHDAGPTEAGPTEAGVRSFFDAEAVDYARSYGAHTHVGYFFRRRSDMVRAVLAEREPGRVLDVGCGPGVMVDAVLDGGHSYRGIDMSPAMVRVAAGSVDDEADAHFQVGRAQQLPFENATFDTALSLGVLEYLSRQDALAALKELRRVLAPDGLALVSVLNGHSPVWQWRASKARLKAFAGARAEGGRSGDATPAPFTIGRARAILVEAGFSIESVSHYSYNVVPARLFDALPGVFAKVSDAMEVLSPAGLRWTGMGILLTVTPDGLPISDGHAGST